MFVVLVFWASLPTLEAEGKQNSSSHETAQQQQRLLHLSLPPPRPPPYDAQFGRNRIAYVSDV